MGKLTIAIGAFILGVASLFAGPENATVVHGHASFQSIANGIEIHSGKQTIINWDNFSIDAGEIARFCQSSSASAVLNRVIGSEQSLINGLLTSNGHVFLLNQNGILVGKDGVIDTAGFVASALDLSNDQFLKGGDFLFKGDGKGSVINLGTIHTRGGDVFLIGYHVSNEGTIQTDGGVAGLASGGEVFLSVEGEERLYIRKEIDSEEIGVSNDGVIRAAEVEIKASGNPFALAIKHGGEIEATGVAHKNGRVLLVADAGKTEVAGLVQAESGTVHVLGDEVTLTEAAAIDVSGEVGGEVLVGGDYQGANLAIPNSRGTYIYKGAEVRANGHHGDGGKVIFWGNETTHYYGDTSAAALGEVGDGGFVEVSAKSNDFIFKGPVNASSINGAKGKLLLDPVNIRVRNAPPTNPPFANPYTPATNATLNPASFVGVLAGGTDVTINATGGGFPNRGNVIFEDPVNWAGSGQLIVNAPRTIFVDPGVTISASNGGGVEFHGLGTSGANSYRGINIEGTISTTDGPIFLEGISGVGSNNGDGVFIQSTGIVTSATGNIQIIGNSNASGDQKNGVRLEGTVSSTVTAPISINGTVSIAADDNADGVDMFGGLITTVDGPIMITGVSFATGNEGGGIEMQNGSTISSTGSGTITLNGTGSTNGTANGHGVKIQSASLPVSSITTVDGEITIIGIGNGSDIESDGVTLGAFNGGETGSFIESTGSGNISIQGSTNCTSSDCHGIRVFDATEIRATGSGTITLDGTGSAFSTGNSSGIKLDTSAVVVSNSGLIDITGVAGVGVDQNRGIAIENSASVTSTTGGITMHGTGDGTGQANYGIELVLSGAVRSVTSGDISLTGISSSLSSFNTDGIVIRTRSTVRSEGSGNITFTGEGRAPGIEETSGVDIISSTIEATGAGTLNFFGDCNANSENSEGVKFQGTASITSTTGKITVHGNNQSNLIRSHGVAFEGSGAVMQTTGGDIEILGNSTMGDTPSHGVFIPTGTISTMGSGTIEITGDIASGTGTTGQNGVEITGSSTSVSTVNGDLSITGHSGGTSGSSFGVLLDNSATVESTGAGNVTLDGESRATGGSDNIGVQVISGSTLSGSSGVVSMIGIGGMGTSGNHGVALSPAGTVTSPGGLVLTGTSQDGDNSLGVLIPATVPVSALGVGNITITGDATNTVGINSHGVQIGDDVTTVTGNIQIDGTSTGDTTSNGIAISSVNVTTTGSGQITMTGNVASGTGTSAQNGVDLDGTSVSTVNGDLSITGRSGGTSGSSFGVLLDNSATVQSAGAGNVTLDGTSRATGGSGNVGVQIIGSSTLSGSGGVVSIIGVGGMGSPNNHGVAFPVPATATVSSPGGLVLNGTSQNGGSSLGVWIPSAATALTSGTGAIMIDGSSDAGSNSEAVLIEGDVTASGTGSITINGNTSDAGGNSEAVSITSSANVTASNTITITGNATDASANSNAVLIQGGVAASGTGAVSVTGNTDGLDSHGIFVEPTGSVSAGSGGITFLATASLDLGPLMQFSFKESSAQQVQVLLA